MYVSFSQIKKYGEWKNSTASSGKNIPS